MLLALDCFNRANPCLNRVDDGFFIFFYQLQTITIITHGKTNIISNLACLIQAWLQDLSQDCLTKLIPFDII